MKKLRAGLRQRLGARADQAHSISRYGASRDRGEARRDSIELVQVELSAPPPSRESSIAMSRPNLFGIEAVNHVRRRCKPHNPLDSMLFNSKTKSRGNRVRGLGEGK